MVAITVDRNKFFDDVKFRISKKLFRRKKIQVLLGGSFDLTASGLWTHHDSTALSCSDAAFIE